MPISDLLNIRPTNPSGQLAQLYDAFRAVGVEPSQVRRDVGTPGGLARLLGTYTLDPALQFGETLERATTGKTTPFDLANLATTLMGTGATTAVGTGLRGAPRNVVSAMGGTTKTIKGKAPKDSVLSVVAGSNNANYRTGSGEAYLTKYGDMVLDGNTYQVGEKAYLHGDKFFKTPPKELIKDEIDRLKEATGYLDGLKETMWQIDWKEPKTIIAKKGDKVPGLFAGGFEVLTKDTRIINDKRYRNVSDYNRNHGFINIVEDNIERPDFDSLFNKLVDKEIDDGSFEVGGHLHIKNDNMQLSEEQKTAIRRYKEKGGRLGATAIRGLEDVEAMKEAAIMHPESINMLTKPIKKNIRLL